MTRVKETPPALEKRKQPGRIRAIILAVIVHAAFFALIVFGVTWQNRPAAPLQAELWDKLPPAKAADPVKPDPPKPDPPPPDPPKSDPPKPEVKPDPPKPDAAIAEKKEREKREKLEKERREKEKVEKEKRDKAEKQKQDDAKKKREDEKRRQDEDKAKREAEKAREQALSAKQAEMNLWSDKIRARIRSKANVPDTVPTGTELQVRIKILPGGDVLDVTVTRSSGNKIYDAAIERAIRSAQPLPVPPADSELFAQFRDLNLNLRHER
ncbi:energy transducer TonB [Usitatibacter palustris]|uniref:Cell division and transport-associated protein TolA n=1 Tax=Usitatibacter palustris TaxID=2732487 RepID=A0A6M4H4Q6_9PROT|nr:energy transducer TonB [Usitatibacter palustris]QJR14470.1 hypothetical protein DSM104440_01266 [Usitatibacter palustris]